MGTYKLIYDREPQVISRVTDEPCELVWWQVSKTHVDEAYDCDVIIRREAGERRNFEESWFAKKKR